MSGWWLVIGFLAMAACGGGPRPQTLRGKAVDAKGGAVLVLDDGQTFYVSGLDAWPADLFGLRVEVTGTVKTQPLPSQPLVNDAGEHSAGATGSQDVIENATWRPVP